MSDAPRPDVPCPKGNVQFREDGTPHSTLYDDIYFSREDGLAETRHVFLNGIGAPGVFEGRHAFDIAELGFGTGLNLCATIATWADWRNRATSRAHLGYFSVEAHLMSRAEAHQALSHFPELDPISEAVLAQWPEVRYGTHYIDLPQWGVSVTLALMTAQQALQGWEGRFDAWFLDGFSPALNPDMWRPELMARIGALSRPGARLASFTVAGHVRSHLKAAGFLVEKVPGFGRKRQCLQARWLQGGGDEAPPLSRPACAIIGAGIAGASLAWQLKAMGLDPILFEAETPGAGASGNPAGLMSPRLDAGAKDIAGLFADALSYAAGHYARLCPEGLLNRGVRLIPDDAKQASRFETICRQPIFPKGKVRLDGDDLLMDQACGVLPQSILRALLDGSDVRKTRITDWRRTEFGWWLISETGDEAGPFERVFLASGAGILARRELATYDLRAVRGQMERVTGAHAPLENLSWGGYLVPMRDGFVFGASHERDDLGTEPRPEERRRNRETLNRINPALEQSLKDSAITSRAAIRVMTRDYLPISGEIGPGLYILSGQGARGFCVAPLLAKGLACEALGRAQPLPLSSLKRVRPTRLMRHDLP